MRERDTHTVEATGLLLVDEFGILQRRRKEREREDFKEHPIMESRLISCPRH